MSQSSSCKDRPTSINVPLNMHKMQAICGILLTNRSSIPLAMVAHKTGTSQRCIRRNPPSRSFGWLAVSSTCGPPAECHASKPVPDLTIDKQARIPGEMLFCVGTYAPMAYNEGCQDGARSGVRYHFITVTMTIRGPGLT